MCLNPIKIRDKKGRIMAVPCRKCAECLNQKALQMTNYCTIEQQLATMTFFITLTYKNRLIPRASLEVSSWDEQGIYSYVYVNQSKRLTKYYDDTQIMAEVTRDDYNIDQWQKFDLPINSGKIDIKRKGQFGYSCKADLINFIKRLKNNLNENYKTEKRETFRYYAVSEYGPVHFRPHFHLLLFFRSQKAWFEIKHAVSKAWKFGRIDVQLAGQRAGNYCARYINSRGFLPPLYKVDAVKTLCLHSQHFGCGIFETSSRYLQDLQYSRFRSRNISDGDKLREVSTPFSFQSAIFPKTFGYGENDDNLLLERYTLYGKLQEVYRRTKEIPEDEKVSVEQLADFYESNQRIRFGFYSYRQLLYGAQVEKSALRTLLYISKKFLKLCKKYDCHPSQYLEVIKNYYYEKDMETLSCFYTKMQEDFSSGSLSPVYQLNDYDNIIYMSSANFRNLLGNYNLASVEDRQTLNVLINTADQFDVTFGFLLKMIEQLDTDPRMIQRITLQEKILSDSMKHKKLNDLNKVLYG